MPIHLTILIIPPTALIMKLWKIIFLYRVPLEYQPQMKNWIFHYSTRNLNCTIFITNGVLFRNAPHKISKLYACILSMTKSGLRTYWSTSYYRYGVNQLWILTKCNDLRVYTIRASPCYIINTFDLSTLFPHSNIKTDINN